MIFDDNTVQFLYIILGAVLAYMFGRFQHRTEYNENLKAQIFGDLLTIDLPNAYVEFIENPLQDSNFDNFENQLLELRKKCSILQVDNYKKYKKIKGLILELDELSGMQEEHIIDGVRKQVSITEVNAIRNRQNEIHSKMLELYRVLGVDHYKNVMYAGKLKFIRRHIYDYLVNKRDFFE
ncbi:hypothetical protein [Catenibacterium sp.]|uniref:hypothetical protein n=1 Tax=Catenibacterium sp. TaxID=2049022 RepID=UPI003D7729A8